MAAGQIDAERAAWVAFYTRGLSAADAARADEILAADAPGLRVDQLTRKAAALEKKLAPQAVAARKERARRTCQRVEARPEVSGNASLSGREMGTADVMASKAYIDALALKLRRAGMPGPLGSLRVLVMADLTQGRDPLERLATGAAATPPAAESGRPGPARHAQDLDDADVDSDYADVDSDYADVDSDGAGPGSGAARPQGKPAPMPAQLNLTVPIGTLLGWSTAPGDAGGWGVLGAGEARAIAAAAARHPATRWCLTLTAPDGTALAHACAPGSHRGLLDNLAGQPPPGQLTELLRRLSPTFTVIARDNCDHAQAEPRYTPSRKLQHLVRARSAACDAPACQAQAVHADLDHTTPWPAGPTDQCNLGPRCRTHHRAKQAPDWTVQQAAPGVTRWTLPSGRTHITRPTRYES
jgi:hypothetical protein